MTDGRLFISRLAFSLGEVMRRVAQREVDSEAIGRSLETINLDFGRVAVQTPFYWAPFYHDGRGPVRARPGHKIVFFRKPEDDPRIGFGAKRYPVRAADVRRLTKAEFYRYLRDPAKRMIVADSVGPAAGDPFFDRAAKVLVHRARVLGRQRFGAYVTSELADLLKLRERSLIVI